MALVLDSKQFAKYHQRLADNLRPTILRGMRVGAARSIELLVQRTRTAPPANPAGKGTGGAVNTGNMARRWRWLPLPDGVAFVNDAGYSPVVDGGRRPGRFPPREALVPWIRRKLVAPPKKPRRQFGPRMSDEQRRELADKKRLEAAIRRTGQKDPKYGPRRPPRERPKPKRQKGVRRSYSAAEMADRLYFPVARAIARRGLLARRILSGYDAHQQILQYVTRGVIDEIDKEMRKP